MIQEIQKKGVMLKIKEYIERASETAIYPYKDDFWGLDYCITGLVGECGEVYNKLKKTN